MVTVWAAHRVPECSLIEVRGGPGRSNAAKAADANSRTRGQRRQRSSSHPSPRKRANSKIPQKLWRRRRRRQIPPRDDDVAVAQVLGPVTVVPLSRGARSTPARKAMEFIVKSEWFHVQLCGDTLFLSGKLEEDVGSREKEEQQAASSDNKRALTKEQIDSELQDLVSVTAAAAK